MALTGFPWTRTDDYRAASDEYVTKMNRLLNQYTALMNEAAMKRVEMRGPSKAEGYIYQRASEICTEAERDSVGEVRNQWEQRRAVAEQKLREIIYALNPQAASAGDKKTPEKSKNSDASGSDSPFDGEVVTEERVKAWFKEDPGYGFEAVAGMQDVQERLRDCLRDIDTRELDDLLGMGTVHSFFFYGLPGCGKTYIINAFAHELMNNQGQKYTYLSLDGSDILSRYVGDAEKIIKALFRLALDRAPCIVFVDEIDGVCRSRDEKDLAAHVYTMTEAFLTGYSSIVNSGKDIIFMGATNHPERVDNAMLDRVELVCIPLPDREARASQFKRSLKIISLEPGFTYEDMADATASRNYRDLGRLAERIKKMVKKDVISRYGGGAAAAAAVRSGAYTLSRALFEQAKESCIVTPKEDAQRKLDEWTSRAKGITEG